MGDTTNQLQTIDQSILDTLWDFSDPAASAERFQAAADDLAYSEEAREEIATQLARALGLMEQYDDAEAVLDSIVPSSPIVEARIALERGRLRLAQSEPVVAVPLFTKAARRAASGRVTFLTLDALHMLAIADAGHEEEWAEVGFAVLERAGQPRTRRWGVALHNNLGWYLHDGGRAAEALPHFERALEYAREVGTADQRFIGRWAVARCLRTLGRTDEALVQQRSLAEKRPDDPYVAAEIRALTEDRSTIEE
ncbi:tetratricopeptide repeat protein [Leifsonia flava]|uniref:Tetratricopeptide repeat protein n=1 Tax=Orlajensenia leifsoniae TaxID=2561933 RepID=A0A4Y9R519_9MICO|nr:tetratricopeptide repeat protein [Leifsonia flava]TFV99380.1 tetratricopeptide repeat protein [Leifsonia flava]